MDAASWKALHKRINANEKRAVRYRQGVVTDDAPLSVALGGSDVPYTDVAALPGTYAIGDPVAVMTFGPDLIVLGVINGTSGSGSPGPEGPPGPPGPGHTLYEKAVALTARAGLEGRGITASDDATNDKTLLTLGQEWTDDFSADRSADYDFLSGAANFTVASGQLAPLGNTSFLSKYVEGGDQYAAFKFTTPATVGTLNIGFILRYKDANNYIVCNITSTVGATEIFFVYDGALIPVASSGAVLVANTTYWFRAFAIGDWIRCAYHTADPDGGGTVQVNVVGMTPHQILLGDMYRVGPFGLPKRIGCRLNVPSADYRIDNLILAAK